MDTCAFDHCDKPADADPYCQSCWEDEQRCINGTCDCCWDQTPEYPTAGVVYDMTHPANPHEWRGSY